MSVIANETTGILLWLTMTLSKKIPVNHSNSFPWNYLEIVSTYNTHSQCYPNRFSRAWLLLLKTKLLEYIFLSSISELKVLQEIKKYKLMNLYAERGHKVAFWDVKDILNL